MKNFRIILVVFIVSIFVLNSTSAEGIKHQYETKELENSQFEAKLVSGDVEMRWNSSSADLIKDSDWKYWKIVRSSSNAEPVYPEDGYIKYDESKSDFSSYIDLEPKQGANYYRICAITTIIRYCSNVVKIENIKSETGEKKDVENKKKNPSPTTKNIPKKEPSKNLLTEAQIVSINKKLDSISVEKRLETYNKLILKIEKLSAKYNSKTKQLLQEIKEIIQERITKLDSNTLIDDIFNGLED